ncbi:hypothetical protein [uncultured Tateyamaria sp.]|uniref:hypothetical protein n=1 Tax=uncultured Tateyamaria sp. TaxID=455651 RepID=UPI0026101342|nr:hypothetical protein [uncultured Tateyamaria sp.]
MNLEQLKTLSDLKFQKSEQAMATIRQREQVLRAELARLRSLVLDTQAQRPEHSSIRAIGADVIWLKWIGQAQQQLTTELAQVLAQKEFYLPQHRRAHGKKLVAAQLARDAVKQDKQRRQNDVIQSAINHTLHK